MSDKESSEDEADSEIVDILQHDSFYRDLENPMAQSVNQLAVNNPQALLSLAENNLDVEAVLASQECPYNDNESLCFKPHHYIPHNAVQNLHSKTTPLRRIADTSTGLKNGLGSHSSRITSPTGSLNM